MAPYSCSFLFFMRSAAALSLVQDGCRLFYYRQADLPDV